MCFLLCVSACLCVLSVSKLTDTVYCAFSEIFVPFELQLSISVEGLCLPFPFCVLNQDSWDFPSDPPIVNHCVQWVSCICIHPVCVSGCFHTVSVSLQISCVWIKIFPLRSSHCEPPARPRARLWCSGWRLICHSFIHCHLFVCHSPIHSLSSVLTPYFSSYSK